MHFKFLLFRRSLRILALVLGVLSVAAFLGVVNCFERSPQKQMSRNPSNITKVSDLPLRFRYNEKEWNKLMSDYRAPRPIEVDSAHSEVVECNHCAILSNGIVLMPPFYIQADFIGIYINGNKIRPRRSIQLHQPDSHKKSTKDQAANKKNSGIFSCIGNSDSYHQSSGTYAPPRYVSSCIFDPSLPEAYNRNSEDGCFANCPITMIHCSGKEDKIQKAVNPFLNEARSDFFNDVSPKAIEAWLKGKINNTKVKYDVLTVSDSGITFIAPTSRYCEPYQFSVIQHFRTYSRSIELPNRRERKAKVTASLLRWEFSIPNQFIVWSKEGFTYKGDFSQLSRIAEILRLPLDKRIILYDLTLDGPLRENREEAILLMANADTFLAAYDALGITNE